MIVAVLDVNVVISAVLAALGFPRQIVDALRAGRFVAVTSAGMVAEVETKLRLPRISRRYRLTEDDVVWAVDLLSSFARVVVVPAQEVMVVTGDPEDDLVLATCRLSRADYLVTGDRGLLDLGSYAGTAIVPPREFLTILRQGVTGADQ
jgi:putative PIN family toxin of toxin-antitoxin system